MRGPIFGPDFGPRRMADRLGAGISVGAVILALEPPGDGWLSEAESVPDTGTDLSQHLVHAPGDGLHWARGEVFTGDAAVQTVHACGGLFFATGLPNKGAVSEDGLTWSEFDCPGFQAVRALAFGNGVFVSIGDGGFCATSANGRAWTIRSFPSTANILTIAFGAGTFVAGTAFGQIFTASSGSSWTARAFPHNSIIRGLAFGNGVFVAGCHDGKIATSGNGRDWTVRAYPHLNINCIVFGNGRFLMGSTISNTTALSLNGTVWEATPSPNGGQISMAFGNEVFVAVGSRGSVMATSDGRVWLEGAYLDAGLSSSARSSIRNVAFGAGIFIANDELGRAAFSRRLRGLAIDVKPAARRDWIAYTRIGP